MAKTQRVRTVMFIPACPEGYKRTGPPLGIGYIASILLKEGYNVQIVDPSPLNLSLFDIKKIVQNEQPDVVGIYCSSTDRYEAFDLANAVKEVLPNALVVMGGPHVTATASITLQRFSSIDVIVRHEGELTMKELLSVINRGGNIGTVKGISFRRNQEIVSTPSREFIEDLDSLPPPAYHLYPPFSRYSPQGIGGEKCDGIIMSSRGCTFSCPFCYAPNFWGRKFRGRSPKSVVNEMEYQRDEFGVEFIDFSDDTFTLDMVRAERICDEIIKRKVDLTFPILSRVDTINRNLLKKLKDAGCEQIQYGVETGSPRLLKSIQKGITVERIEKVLRWTKEAGIQNHVFLMQGLPGETVKDVELTFGFLKRNRKFIDKMHSTIAVMLPGTALYERAKRLGLIDDEVWFSYRSDHPFLSRDPSLRHLPLYLENSELEELIKFHRLTSILFHMRKRPYKLAMRDILGYAWNYWKSPEEYLDLIEYLFKFA